VDTSVAGKTDRLGRRTGPRRKYPAAEKVRILEETRRPGASIAEVARAHGINANVVFGWRRLAQRGLLRAQSTESAPLLPVKVESPTLLPTVRATPGPSSTPGPARERGLIEIEFSGGIRVRLHGAVDARLLKRVFKMLARR
jgi:transposase